MSVRGMRWRCRGASFVAGAIILALPGVTQADAPPVDAAIAWSAPAECPDEGAVRAEIARLLGRPLGRSGVATQVRGEMVRDSAANGRYRLKLSITRAGVLKERQLDGETCAQVTDAAAVVLALAIDAAGLPSEPPPPAAVFPPVDPAPPPLVRSAPTAERPASSAVATPRPRAIWDVAALAGIDAVSLPEPAAGLGLGAGVNLGANRIELRAMAWLPRRAMLGATSSLGADLSLYAAGLRYCRWLFRGMFDLAPCGGLEAGALVASAVGVAPIASGPGRWLDPQLGLLGVFRPTPRFAVSLAADGLASIFRDRFVIAGTGAVYQPPPATFRATLGVHVRVP